MHKLNVKMIAKRDSTGEITEFFLQSVAEMNQSNFIPLNSAVSATTEGVKVTLTVDDPSTDYMFIETPVVQQVTIPGVDLTVAKPIVEVCLVHGLNGSTINKRIIHRDDSDEDQQPDKRKG